MTALPLSRDRHGDVVEPPSPSGWTWLGVLRIAYGFTFLWAFLDKLLALGYSTGRAEDDTVDYFGDAAWINGGSPTEGYLGNAPKGPFQDFYNNIAGAWWADWLFMIGLCGLGLALTLGIGMTVAGISGTIMYVMMWTVVLPPSTNPVIDDHILGALAVLVLWLFHAGDHVGFGRAWKSTGLVQRWSWLR